MDLGLTDLPHCPEPSKKRSVACKSAWPVGACILFLLLVFSSRSIFHFHSSPYCFCFSLFFLDFSFFICFLFLVSNYSNFFLNPFHDPPLIESQMFFFLVFIFVFASCYCCFWKTCLNQVLSCNKNCLRTPVFKNVES